MEGPIRIAYEVQNPLKAKSFEDLAKTVGDALFDVAVAAAVILYIYAGVLYLTAGAKPENVSKAKRIFGYTTLGLVIIFIGGGFVDLIKSVLGGGR